MRQCDCNRPENTGKPYKGLQTEVFPFKELQVSIGVSGIRDDRTIDEIFIEAEKALIKSKQSGKNRITLIG